MIFYVSSEDEINECRWSRFNGIERNLIGGDKMELAVELHDFPGSKPPHSWPHALKIVHRKCNRVTDRKAWQVLENCGPRNETILYSKLVPLNKWLDNRSPKVFPIPLRGALRSRCPSRFEKGCALRLKMNFIPYIDYEEEAHK